MTNCLASLSILILFQNYSEKTGSVFPHNPLLISVQNLTQGIKSNTTGSLRVQKDSRKIGLLAIESNLEA